MAAEEREKISCVGTPTGNVRVYLEENCAEYLREKTASELGDFQMFGLLGREYRLGDQIIFLIRGILENRGNGTRQMQISLETIRAMETEKERFNNINTLDGIRSKLDVLDQQIEQIHTGMFGTE